MHRNLKRGLLALLAVAAVGATLRFEHAVIDEGPGIRTHTRWRILVPFQTGGVRLAYDGNAQTEEYACYGLLPLGGVISSSHSFRCTIPH